MLIIVMQRILTIMIQYKFTLFGLLFYGAYDQKSTNSLGMFVVLVIHTSTFQGIKESKSRGRSIKTTLSIVMDREKILISESPIYI